MELQVRARAVRKYHREAPHQTGTTPVLSLFVFPGFAALLVLIFYERMAYRLRDGFLWAEDATVFLKGAYEQGFHSLFEQYAGYLHFDSRLIALVIACLTSPPGTPYVMPWVCLAVYAIIATYLYAVSLRLTGSSSWHPIVAGVAALAPFLVPQSGEVYLNLTNLQWMLALPMLACLYELTSPLVSYSLSRTQIVWRGIFLASVGLTGPFGVLALPVAIAAILVTRQNPRHRTLWIGLGAYLCASGMQFVIGLGLLPSSTQTASVTDFSWFVEFMHSFIAELFLFKTPQERHLAPIFPMLVTAAIVAVACTRPFRYIKLSLLAFALLLWCIGERRVAMLGITTPHMDWNGVNSRYLFIPHVLVFWIFCLNLSSVANPRWTRILSAAGACVIVATSLHSFRSSIWWSPAQWSIQRTAADTYEFHVAPQGVWEATIIDYHHSMK